MEGLEKGGPVEPGMVLLVHASLGEAVSGEIKKHGVKRWLFLSRNYPRLRFYERAIGGSASRVRTGGVLASKAGEMRGAFLETMSALDSAHGSIEWWSLKLAEKNTLESDLFLNVCYLGIAEDEIGSGNGICIIAESRALLETLRDKHPGSIVLALKAPRARAAAALKGLLPPVKFLSAHLVKGLLALVYLDRRRGEDFGKGKKRFLIFTYADEKSLGPDGRFRDRYFPGLAEWLSARGYEALTFAKVLNVRKGLLGGFGWFREAFKWFGKAEGNFLIEYSYYRPSDYLFPVLVYFRQRGMRFKGASLGGLDLGRLLSEEVGKGQVIESLLHFRLAKRLGESGIVPDVYIDSYENMLPERMMRLGVREHLSGARIISYQHAPYFPHLLCMFLSGSEHGFAPDRLVCSGRAMMRIAEGAGFPRERIVLGPALRYQHLQGLKNAHHGETGPAPPAVKTLLVVIPFELTLAEELLSKVHEAFADEKGYELVLKPHPFTARRQIVHIFERNGLAMPSNFRFTDREMYLLLPEVDCTILMATSALLELCVLGMPYVNVGSEWSLPHDPTEWFEACERPVYTALEIKESVKSAVRAERKEERLPLDEVFEPLSEKAMEAFL